MPSEPQPEDHTFGADMFLGNVVSGRTGGVELSYLAAVDHRDGSWERFETVGEMATYVVGQFGANYASHITYRPPMPPYEMLSPRQIDEFVLAVHDLLQ